MTSTVRPSPDDLRRASSDLFTGLDPQLVDALNVGYQPSLEALRAWWSSQRPDAAT